MTESLDPFIRTDLEEATPDRLNAARVRAALDEPTFQSRAHNPGLRSMVGCIETRLLEAGRKSPGDPSFTVLSETEAVDVVLAELTERYPLWFGDDDHLPYFDEPVADEHLSTRAIREWYFQNEVVIEDVDIDVSERRSWARVVAPILARVAERLADQRAADAEAATSAGQRRIKREVIRAVVDENLSAADIDKAVAEAKEELLNSEVDLD